MLTSSLTIPYCVPYLLAFAYSVWQSIRFCPTVSTQQDRNFVGLSIPAGTVRLDVSRSGFAGGGCRAEGDFTSGA